MFITMGHYLLYVRLCVSLYITIPFKWSVGVCYLVVHDRSQAHDAHMHIIFLAHEAGVFDGFAV